MKHKDLALIAVIVVVSAVFSLVVSNLIFGSPQKNQQQAEVVEPITANFPEPDSKYFNDKAVNPTQQITIGQNANTQPFSGTSP